jgi:hypothetical protein
MFRKDSTGRSESSRPANPVKRLSTAALAAVLSIALIVPQAWADQNTVQTTLDSQSQQLEVEQSSESADTQANEPTDWNDSFDQLTLSSESGLSVNDASDEQKQSNANLTELPEQISATLGLDVALKAGRTIIAGDYFHVSLPDGLTAQTYAADDADDETKQNATFDVLQRNDDQDTEVKIAEARFVTQSLLKVTFVDPANVNTGEVADSIEEASARLQLNVNLDSSLVKNKSSELKWTLQTKTDDSAGVSADGSTQDSTSKTTTRETKLVVPSKKQIASKLGITLKSNSLSRNAAPLPATVSETDGEITVFTGDVANDPTRFYMTKVSATDSLHKLSGAVFELTGIFAGQTSATTKTLTTDETGYATIDKAQLIADGQTEYTLTETQAPNGYLRLAQSYTFTVATDGTITPTQDVTGYSVNATGENAAFTVTAADTPIALKLIKEAAGLDGNLIDGQKLARAVFTITPATDGETFADGTSTTITVATNDEGSAQLSAQLIAGHSYNVKETTAPTGYQMTDVTYTVTVDDQGNATWSIGGQTIGTDGKDGLFPQAADGEHQAVAIVANKVALATMPHSGKIFGLSPISVAGLLLIAAGITAMAIARRRRNA